MNRKPTLDEMNHFESLDDQQIGLIEMRNQGKLIDRMEGSELLDRYIYVFGEGDTRTTGISIQGVLDAWGLLGGFEIKDSEIDIKGEQYWIARVVGRNMHNGQESVAAKCEPIMEKGRFSEHAATQAMSKAQGKVMRDLLPGELVEELKRVYMKRQDDKALADKQARTVAQISLHPHKGLLERYIDDDIGKPIEDLTSDECDEVLSYMSSPEFDIDIKADLVAIIIERASKDKQKLYISRASQHLGRTIEDLEDIPVDLLEKIAISL